MASSTVGRPRVTALVVTTYDFPHLPTLWKDLSAQDYPALELVVVDNDSKDGSREFVGTHPLPIPVRVVQRASNEGLTRAWNTGLGVIDAPWVLLLSPDCRFPPNLVSSLVDRAEVAESSLKGHGRVGGVSPVFDSRGRPGAPLGLPPHFHPRQAGVPSTVLADGESFAHHGACAIVSRDLLRRLGGFDANLFFGGDEVDTALQAHLLGYHFYQDSRVRADHPYEPRRGGKKGRLVLLRATSGWFLLLKHAGITITWGTLLKEAVDHFFWQGYARSPRFLAQEAVWFVRSGPTLAEERRALRKLWAERT